MILSLVAGAWVPSPALAATAKVSEASPPSGLVALQRRLDRYAPQVTIVSPKPDTVLQENSVAVTFAVKDLPIFKDAKLGLGPHLHVVLDEDAYVPVYDLSSPLMLKDLKPGTHTIRAFASRPWHESFKNEGAFAQSTFHLLTKTQDDQPDPKLPLLTYSRPQGSYGAEPIMLDYYLTNAPLHIVAKDRKEISDWRIKATVNGNTSFILDRWQPIYLKGFEPGKNWVQLEFVDPKGKPIANVYNNTVRVFDYQPGGDDTLAKLVRGDLSAAAAMTIVDPNYVPPVAKPVEPAKVVEPAKAPEPKAEMKTPEVKSEVKAPEVKAPEVKTPEVKTPEVKVPEVKTPEVKTPEVKTPEVKPAAKPEVKVNPLLVPIPIPMGRPKSPDQPINSIVPKEPVRVSPGRSQPKPEVKPEVKSEVKPEAKTPAKVEVKPAAKVEVKPPAKVEVKTPAKLPEVKNPEVKAPEVKTPEVNAPEAKVPWFKLPSLPKAMPIPVPVGKPTAPPAIKAPEKPAAKVEVKTPAKVEIKPPAKVEVKTPAKVEIKPPAKLETKAPIKLTPKAPAPAKVETKVPAKVETKAPAKVEIKAPAKQIEVKPVAKPIAPKAPAPVAPKVETKAPAKVEPKAPAQVEPKAVSSWLDRLRDVLPKADTAVPPVPAKVPVVAPKPVEVKPVAPKPVAPKVRGT
ncbi:MAG: hypothetical protein HC860_23640 [Alkalinema sp. RU_4_3]|nr:hypothetical protein [Alkalinema sp. RU_4_3]